MFDFNNLKCIKDYLLIHEPKKKKKKYKKKKKKKKITII